MNLNTKGAATGILVVLSLIFFGVGVWLHVYFPADAAFNAEVWAIFSMTFGGTLVILRSEAGGETPQPPAQPESTSVVPKE